MVLYIIFRHTCMHLKFYLMGPSHVDNDFDYLYFTDQPNFIKKYIYVYIHIYRVGVTGYYGK